MNPEEDSQIKTPVSDLKIGMYVSRLDKDWTQSSFLFQGFLIEDDEQMTQLKAECSYVYIDAAKEEIVIPQATAVKVATAPIKKAGFSFSQLRGQQEDSLGTEKPVELKREQTNRLRDITEHKVAAETIKPPKKVASFSHEMGVAKLAHGKTTTLLKNVMTDVKASQDASMIDGQVAESAIQDCMSSVLRSPDAMLLAMKLKGKHHSTWQHCMNVSMLAMNLGRFLNIADEELVTLGLCGMFHDIGNLLISKEELDKAGDKRELIRSHTTLGGDFLSKSGKPLNGEVAEVAYSHHENLDGSGFPRGLKGDQITPYTRIITIVDLYDTLTSDKTNRKGLSHYEAMIKILKEVEAGHLDKMLVDSFNQCIGTYPVGCFVEMNSGEIGVVVEENPEQRLKPIVMLLTTPDKQERPKQLVNLAKASFDGKANTYAIKSFVNPEHYHLEI
jgi:putative nucleotidyltransferase with HDIG domain